MKYIMQNDYPHIRYATNFRDPADDRMTHGTFARSGCGLAALMMVADRLLVNYKVDMRDAIKMANDTSNIFHAGQRHGFIAIDGNVVEM